MKNLNELSNHENKTISGGTTRNPIASAMGTVAGTFYGYFCLGLEAFSDFFLEK